MTHLHAEGNSKQNALSFINLPLARRWLERMISSWLLRPWNLTINHGAVVQLAAGVSTSQGSYRKRNVR